MIDEWLADNIGELIRKWLCTPGKGSKADKPTSNHTNTNASGDMPLVTAQMCEYDGCKFFDNWIDLSIENWQAYITFREISNTM